MAIILCLFLVMILGGYSCYHKLNTVARQEERLEIAKEYEDHCFEVYVEEEEETIEKRRISLQDEVYYNHGLPAQPGMEEAREMRHRICNEAGIQPTAEMVMCGLLAQDGKVPYDLTWTTYVPTPIEPRRKHWEVEHKFLHWLDEEQHIHGIPFRIKFVPSGTHVKYAEPFTSSNVTLRMGRYIWHPDQAVGCGTFIKQPYDYDAPFVDYR